MPKYAPCRHCGQSDTVKADTGHDWRYPHEVWCDDCNDYDYTDVVREKSAELARLQWNEENE